MRAGGHIPRARFVSVTLGYTAFVYPYAEMMWQTSSDVEMLYLDIGALRCNVFLSRKQECLRWHCIGDKPPLEQMFKHLRVFIYTGEISTAQLIFAMRQAQPYYIMDRDDRVYGYATGFHLLPESSQSIIIPATIIEREFADEQQ